MDEGGGFAAEPQKRDTDKILEGIWHYASNSEVIKVFVLNIS